MRTSVLGRSEGKVRRAPESAADRWRGPGGSTSELFIDWHVEGDLKTVAGR